MMSISKLGRLLPGVALLLLAMVAGAQTFKVQCPNTTTTHPAGDGIKCQQISGGDGFATMGDGTQTYLFAFGPLSGLMNLYNGLPGTTTASEFNSLYTGATPLQPGDPATSGTAFNGAVGLIPNLDANT